MVRGIKKGEEMKKQSNPPPLGPKPAPPPPPPRSRCNQEFDFFDKSPDNLKAAGDRLMKVIEEAHRNNREFFINKIKDSFEEIDKFAEGNQKEIFVLNGYKNCLGINAIYVGAWVDEIQIRLIYKESYWGESERFEFDIPLEYMNNLNEWLEDLRKEKEEKDKKRDKEKTEASLGSGI
jgi:hypothetical protein